MNELKLNLKVTGPKFGDAFCKMTASAAALVENIMYSWATNNVEDYNGGSWENVETEDGAVYRRLTADGDGSDNYKHVNETKVGTFTISNPGAYWTGKLSADAMGIVATLYGLNHALWRIHEKNESLAEKLSDAYHKLLAFTRSHPEGSDIAMAID